MSLSTRQRYCLEQMGYTIWRSRAAEAEAASELHWLADTPTDGTLQLVLQCTERPDGQWLDDLLNGLRVSRQQAAWCTEPAAYHEHSPRWILTLPGNWPEPSAKRELWRQAQAQFRQ